MLCTLLKNKPAISSTRANGWFCMGIYWDVLVVGMGMGAPLGPEEVGAELPNATEKTFYRHNFELFYYSLFNALYNIVHIIISHTRTGWQTNTHLENLL